MPRRAWTAAGADPPCLPLARRCLEPEPEARPRDAGVVATEITRVSRRGAGAIAASGIGTSGSAGTDGSGEAVAAAQAHARRLAGADRARPGLAASWSLERRAPAAAEVESDLTVAEQAGANGQWAAARAAAERAGGRLGSSGPEELQRRLQRMGDDLDMLAEARTDSSEASDIADGHFNRADAVAEYAAAFQKFDLDVLTLDVGEAARRLAHSAIAEPLLAALDDWLLLLEPTVATGTIWSRSCRQADTDARRLPLRTAWAAQDWTSLRQLANPQDRRRTIAGDGDIRLRGRLRARGAE